MNGIVAENGKVVTDEMIADWESALERDEWPSGWVNVGEIVEEDMTDSEESEEPLFEEFSEYVPKFCPNCGVNLREP